MLGDRYYYHRLNKKNQSLYRLILKAATDYVTSFRSYVQESYSEKDLAEINRAIIYDNPYLFYYSGLVSLGFTYPNEIQINLSFDFDQRESDELKKKLKEQTVAFLKSIKLSDKTEEERVRAVHDLLSSKVIYDRNSIDNTNTIGKSEEYKYAHSILGVMLNKKAVCEGIAKAFKYLLNAIDIGCIVVTGAVAHSSLFISGTDINHAWNLVKIEGDNYYTDVTWDIAEVNNNHISYNYYNLTEIQMRKDHFEFEGFPTCDSIRHNFFALTGTIMYSEEMLYDYADSIIRKHLKEFYVRLEFECNYMKVFKRLEKYILEALLHYYRTPSLQYLNCETQKIIRIFLTCPESSKR